MPAPRVVVIDSGIDVHHPGVRGRGRVIVGPAFDDAGGMVKEGAGADHLGHGTAVASVILGHCPSAELIAVRVFDATADCVFDRVLHALRWAGDQRADLINLSLGTTAEKFAPALRALVAPILRAGTRIVAPATREGLPVLPGTLDGVDAVVPDPNVPSLLPQRRVVDARASWGRAYWFAASTADGLSLRLEGASLATAHVSGYLARQLR